MWPVIQTESEFLPAYVTSGENNELFSVDFEHNGVFCGDGVNISYIGSTHDVFDFCQSDSWSLAKIGYCLNYLGYNVEDPALSVYWCLPGKDIVDGLVQANTAEVCAAMVNASKETKTLSLIVDEKNRLKSLWDDIIVNGCPELPRVLSPRKMPSSARSGEETSKWQSSGKEKVVQVEEIGEAEQTNEEDEIDPEFIESDYDVQDGDDDLFLENVDKAVGDHNEKEGYVEEDDALDDDDINLSAEELSKLRYTFNAFNPELDMANPAFKVGMVFADMKELRKALDADSVRHRVKIYKPRNESERLNAECSDGWPWHLKASKDNRTGNIVVRQYNGTHNCKKIWDSNCLTVKLLTEKFIEEFRDNQKMDLGTFGRKVQREFKLLPNKMKLRRARKAALEIIHGDEASQYGKLWNFGQELRRSNPGSRFIVCTTEVKEKDDEEPKDCLSSMYCSFDACKRGFLKGCRPIIFVDGCHLKSRYKGQLLTAVGIDPNDCIVPIAMGMVEVESTFSWQWFLTTLKNDLNIVNTSPYTIMSDKQKGLIKVVQVVFPDSEHRFCVRHLYENYRKLFQGETLKNHLWAIARSTNLDKWNVNRKKLRADCQPAYDWLDEKVPKQWVKAFSSDFPKCEIVSLHQIHRCKLRGQQAFQHANKTLSSPSHKNQNCARTPADPHK